VKYPALMRQWWLRAERPCCRQAKSQGYCALSDVEEQGARPCCPQADAQPYARAGRGSSHFSPRSRWRQWRRRRLARRRSPRWSGATTPIRHYSGVRGRQRRYRERQEIRGHRRGPRRRRAVPTRRLGHDGHRFDRREHHGSRRHDQRLADRARGRAPHLTNSRPGPRYRGQVRLHRGGGRLAKTIVQVIIAGRSSSRLASGWAGSAPFEVARDH
jgi:hypothetical protein